MPLEKYRKTQEMSKFTRAITFNSLYAAWYWGYLPFGPPKASCHVSIKVNIFSLTLKSGCSISKECNT